MLNAIKRRVPLSLKIRAREGIGTSLHRWRALPSFFVIGAQKSGTTSLYDYLTASPGVRAARVKEVGYYSTRYRRGVNWYRGFFPLTLGKQAWITGEATPEYLFHPEAPGRLRTDYPEARLIITLRDPAVRAYSHYRHSRRKGVEPLSFRDALHAEPSRLATVDWDDPGSSIYRHSYLARGRYAEQLTRWLDFFPVEQIHVVGAEELFANPSEVCLQITEWLEVPPSCSPGFVPLNVGDGQNEDVAGQIDQLRSYFYTSNQGLFELVGRAFDWGQ